MTSEPRREEASEDPRMTQRDEPDLLRRCREGDERAFDDLFRHHYAPAVRYAARVSPSLDPEDLTAEAFARIWPSPGSGRRSAAAAGPSTPSDSTCAPPSRISRSTPPRAATRNPPTTTTSTTG